MNFDVPVALPSHSMGGLGETLLEPPYISLKNNCFLPMTPFCSKQSHYNENSAFRHVQ